jgi:surface polysaccharide O-acyltransferase-like enzyme
MRTRDYGIEAARVLFMVGICAIHAVYQGGMSKSWWACLLGVNVGAFVFLSGWFGIRFSFLKMAKLLGVGVYATIVAYVGNSMLTGQMDWRYLKLFKGHWFLWTYLGLMMLAPMLDVAVVKSRRSAILILALAFGWGFLFHLPFIGGLLGSFSGLGSNGIVSFMGIYVAARLLRQHDGGILSRGKVCAFIVGVIGVLLTRHGGTSSPFSFLVGASVVMMARRINMPNAASKVISWLSPSLFAIYLIHSNSFGFAVIRFLEGRMQDSGWGLCAIYVAVTLIMFLGAFILDLPRRMVVGLISRLKICDGGH